MVRQARNTVSPVTGAKPELTILTGDNADSQQYNETRWFIDILDGTTGSGEPRPEMASPPVGARTARSIRTPGSRPGAGCCPGTLPDNGGLRRRARRWSERVAQDGGYYEPDSSRRTTATATPPTARETGRDAGPHADVRVRDYVGLFERANEPFEALGLGMPWYTAFGNHDALIQGNSPDAYAGPLGPGPAPGPEAQEIFDPAIHEVATGCVKVMQPATETMDAVNALVEQIVALQGGGTTPDEQQTVDALIGEALTLATEPCDPQLDSGCVSTGGSMAIETTAVAGAEIGASETPEERAKLRRVIVAASVGTLFEWYDFYLYGSLAIFFGALFFPSGNETAQLLASLATFGAGFGVRPLGAIVFGYVGDLVGRKYTFLITMVTMGLSTAFVGLLPTYASAGLLATFLLVALRLLQGLALGGEYGGAATYIAEHVPDHKRGYYTSFIQTTATLGFFLSMGVIGGMRVWLGEEAFREYGWRIPFLMSFLLIGVSLYIRLKMQESPLFTKLKAEGRTSVNPLKESFMNPVNLKYVLLALFGAAAGQGVVWYTGQFYALTFLQSALGIVWQHAYLMMSAALLLTTPLFIVFGALSDRIGRKKVMLTGCALAALTYVPIYMGMRYFSDPINWPMMILLLTLQMVYVCMVYGPIAAFLVELFPTKIRYTSMSLPYHLGNGWFGGFLPLIATAVTASSWARNSFGDGAIYTGLIYPIVVCVITVIIGGIFIRETKDHKIDV